MKASLLVELRTEELPPKALQALGRSFSSAIYEELLALGLAGQGPYQSDLATPRRLAVLVPGVEDKAASEEKEVQGPSTSAPSQAVAGFAKKHGVAVDTLGRAKTPKGEVFVARVQAGGAVLDAVLAGVVDKAVKKLPIPKVMRWGDGDARFVRPVHGLVMLHGARVVPGEVLGLDSGNRTLGHRFLSPGPVVLAKAEDYEQALEGASVVASFDRRRAEIDKQLRAKARELGGSLGENLGALLDEVTALVEYPAVYAGAFDAAFLAVPQECLILTMRQNQKYFPLFDAQGKLQPRFLIVSNMRVADPRHIVGGNERVVRPRLADARFFFDRTARSSSKRACRSLAKVVYHNKLGTQLERVQRIRLLAGKIARELGRTAGADPLLAERAAQLAKADLLTGMVGEFPELQGVMGRYYALHDGEPAEVADAIEQHYWPRFAGDALPKGDVSMRRRARRQARCAGGHVLHRPAAHGRQGSLRPAPRRARRRAHPDGEPPARSRCATLVKAAVAPFEQQGRRRRSPSSSATACRLPEGARLHAQRGGRGARAQQPDRLEPGARSSSRRCARSHAARGGEPRGREQAHRQHPQAGRGEGRDVRAASPDRPEGAAELRAALARCSTPSAMPVPLFERGDYTGYLKSFAVLKAPVDAFFDKVMVMVEDPKLRRSRLALLHELRTR